MDEDKIRAEGKYTVESIYRTIKRGFDKYKLREEQGADGTRIFYGSGDPRDYGVFGLLITTLREESWFMDYVAKWLWYNSDDGRNEDDFAIEDVLYHYTRKRSAA